MAVGLGAAAITAGATLLGSAGSIAATGKLNKKNRQWQEHMWNKTNEYNHPVSQMQRFKDAGLNPHLIYGQGDNGNTSMPAAPKQEVPDYGGFAEAALNYVATRKQQAEIDNMQKAQQVMDADIIAKNASAAASMSQSAWTDTQKQQSETLFDTIKATAEANLNSLNTSIDKIKTETASILKQMDATDQQIKLSNAQIDKISVEVQEAAERIKLLKAEGDYKRAETERIRLENEFRRNGINPNASPIQKILFDVINPLIQDRKEGMREFFNNVGKDPKGQIFKGFKPWQK